MARGGTTTRRKAKAMETLLHTPSVRLASQESGIPVRTLWRWLADPTFTDELTKQERLLIDEGRRMLAAQFLANLGTLVKLRQAEDVTPATRIRAAVELNDCLLRLEDRDVERRLDRLEALNVNN